MPEPGAAAYLLRHLAAVGPTTGESAITSAELKHYQENMGIALNPWECATLRRLSIDYLNESQLATQQDRKPPYGDSNDAARLKQAEIDRKLSLFLD